MILALDPGRSKTGVAVIDKYFQVLFKDIISTGELETQIPRLLHKYEIETVVVGDGTTSQELLKRINLMTPDSLEVEMVDEANSTEEAEERYREENPLTGWKKIFSFIGSWRPARPVDDYVAVILAERYLKRNPF